MKRFAHNTWTLQRVSLQHTRDGWIRGPHRAGWGVARWWGHRDLTGIQIFPTGSVSIWKLKVHKMNRNDFDFSFTSWCEFRSKHCYSAAHARFTCKHYPLGSGLSSYYCRAPPQSDICLHNCTLPVLFQLDEQNQFCSSPIWNGRKRHVTSLNASYQKTIIPVSPNGRANSSVFYSVIVIFFLFFHWSFNLWKVKAESSCGPIDWLSRLNKSREKNHEGDAVPNDPKGSAKSA